MAPPKLLDQVSAVARLRHLSIRTEMAYRYHIKQFILFHNKRHPTEMREYEIRACLTHLAVDDLIVVKVPFTQLVICDCGEWELPEGITFEDYEIDPTKATWN